MRRGPFFVAAATSIATMGALGARARAMTEAHLTHLEVLHVSDALTTRAALTPQAFEAHAGLRRTAVSDAALVAESLRRIREAHEHAGNAAPDVRWGLVYSDAGGMRRRSLYLDKFGKRAVLDGQVITLEGASLVQWLRTQFGG